MSGRKYYLGFTFGPEIEVGLHVTHCYFGELTEIRAASIIRMVQTYLDTRPMVTLPRVVFDIPTVFGNEEERVRVLCTKTPEELYHFQPLRELFISLGFLDTRWPFRPHVTTHLFGRVDRPFYSYAMVCDGYVVQEWKPETGEACSMQAQGDISA